MATATATPAGTRSKKPAGTYSNKRQVRRNTLIGWSFLLPNFLGFALLTLVPVVATFGIAFTEWDSYSTPEFLGLDNFERLLTDNNFRTALLNTLYYAAGHIPITLAVSLGLALLLNRKARGVNFFRTAAFFPYITSIVAVAVVWNMLFNPSQGPVNQAPHRPRHRQPARLDLEPAVGDARRHHHQRVAGHGLLHDPLPRRAADGPARGSTRPRRWTARTPGSGSATSPCRPCGRRRSSC